MTFFAFLSVIEINTWGDRGWVTSFSLARFVLFNSYSASHDNWCTVGGDGGCRVGEVRACTTSPMPDHKGFKIQHFKG